jgi:outer membrane protein TolC
MRSVNLPVCIILILSIFTANAQTDQIIIPAKITNPPELPDSSTLETYLEFAALNNAQLESAFNQWQAAVQRIDQKRALPDPKISYRYFIREIETSVGPQKQAFEISQMFPWFGKLKLTAKVEIQAAKSQFQKYESAKRNLFLQVRDVYYEYYYLGQSIAITQVHIDLVKNVEQIARTRYKTASGSHLDVIRAQVELGKLQDRLSSLRDLQNPIQAKFNAVLNRDINAKIPIPKEIYIETPDVNETRLFKQLTSNPILLALHARVNQFQTAARLAKKQYYPNMTLGLSYLDMSNAPFGANPRDNGKDAAGIMFSFNIPIQHKRISAKVRQMKLHQIASVKEQKNQLNILSSQLKMALYRLRDAQRKINLYSKTLLPKANESLKVAQTAFSSSKGGFLDLIDTQRIYLDFQLAYEQARTHKAKAMAQIIWLTGNKTK